MRKGWVCLVSTLAFGGCDFDECEHDYDCADGEYCLEANGRDGRCEPLRGVGETCTYSGQCEPDLVCDEGRCEVGCSPSKDGYWANASWIGVLAFCGVFRLRRRRPDTPRGASAG